MSIRKKLLVTALAFTIVAAGCIAAAVLFFSEGIPLVLAGIVAMLSLLIALASFGELFRAQPSSDRAAHSASNTIWMIILDLIFH